MLEELQRWVTAVSGYLGPLSFIGGSLVGFTLTASIERYFLPIAIDPAAKRRQKGITFLFCWWASGTASSLLWWALAGDDPLFMRLTVSFVLGVLSFRAYPPIIRWADKKAQGQIGSAWREEDGQP